MLAVTCFLALRAISQAAKPNAFASAGTSQRGRRGTTTEAIRNMLYMIEPGEPSYGQNWRNMYHCVGHWRTISSSVSYIHWVRRAISLAFCSPLLSRG